MLCSVLAKAVVCFLYQRPKGCNGCGFITNCNPENFAYLNSHLFKPVKIV